MCFVEQFGDTPLLDAAKHGQMDVVAALLSKGVDASHRNKMGKTAADLASENNHMDVYTLLLLHSLK